MVAAFLSPVTSFFFDAEREKDSERGRGERGDRRKEEVEVVIDCRIRGTEERGEAKDRGGEKREGEKAVTAG